MGRKWAIENPKKHNASVAAWKKRNPEKVKEYNEKWRKENKDYMKRWKAEHPENCLVIRKRNTKNKLLIRNYQLRREYGIDLQKYNLMFAEQNGRCAICGRHQSELKKALAVDHSHTTNIVRGLLCSRCNLGLGCLKDNIELLFQAIRYLNKTEKSLSGSLFDLN